MVLVAGATIGGTTSGYADIPTITSFAFGDLVVSVEGNGPQTSGVNYTDNQAAPLTLYEYALSGTSSASFVGGLVLPQNANSTERPASTPAATGTCRASTARRRRGRSSSPGTARAFVILGYGVNASQYNANYQNYGPSAGNAALAQSGSLTGQSYTPVARVAAVIGQNGSVNSTTALYNVFDQNNPRSVASVNGTSFYVSGQGAYPDSTGGVFYATLGSHSATSITGNDAGSGASQDTRTVEIVNNTLGTVSTDSKKGSTNRDYIGTLGTAGSLPTTVANSGNGPAMLTGFGNAGGTGKVTITAGTTNGVNSAGQQVILSPSNFFFADADTLYVADTGAPKNSRPPAASATAACRSGPSTGRPGPSTIPSRPASTSS